jgi:hypothetical protein
VLLVQLDSSVLDFQADFAAAVAPVVDHVVPPRRS